VPAQSRREFVAAVLHTSAAKPSRARVPAEGACHASSDRLGPAGVLGVPPIMDHCATSKDLGRLAIPYRSFGEARGMTTAHGHIGETIVHGLTNYARGMEENDAVQMGAALYGTMARKINSVTTSADTCRLAFPSILVDHNKAHLCLIIVLDNRVVIASKDGPFRRARIQTIPISYTTEVGPAVHPRPDMADTRLLTISGSPGATIALPVAKADKAMALITAAIRA
jgi:hypothetical protein